VAKSAENWETTITTYRGTELLKRVVTEYTASTAMKSNDLSLSS